MSDTDEQTVEAQDSEEVPEAREPVPRGASAPDVVERPAGRPAQQPEAGERQPEAGERQPESEEREADAAPAPQAEGDEQPPESEEREALAQDVDELLQAAAKRDEYLALAQRTQADFENYRKRVAREAAKSERRGMAKLAKELLPALDNLDRALDAAAAEDPLLEGVGLVRSELHAALARQGIEAFSPVGEQFDPSLHEAVAQQPVQGAASGSVAEVYQAGYKLEDEVIRPARVLVAA